MCSRGVPVTDRTSLHGLGRSFAGRSTHGRSCDRRIVPDGDRLFTHTAEGDDDMPAHVRSVLTQTSLGIPIADGTLVLGTWQGLYLWEHRTSPHERRVTVTVIGA